MDLNKKKIDSLEEYLSFVRHELRNQLLVVREGVSQVTDGLGNKDCDKCNKILKPAMEYADKINKSISEMLNNDSFKFVSEKQNSNNQNMENLEISKNELMIVINHLVRTPLTVIKEGLSLVLDEVPGRLNPEQKKLLDEVKENSDRMIASIEKILKTPLEKIPDLLEEYTHNKIGYN